MPFDSDCTSSSSTQSSCVGGEAFLADVLNGLSQKKKSLPCKYFYDARGSELFDQICDVEEYYVTRTEAAILESSIALLADALPSSCVLIEPGAGSAAKTRTMLTALMPDTYVPIDISADYLAATAERLRNEYDGLDVVPFAGDFTQLIELPRSISEREDRVVFFPGSTIGNFSPDEAIELLRSWHGLVGRSGHLVIGVDVVKSSEVLEAAYDDQDGVTGRFNLNLLHRINTELGADFDVDRFSHRAVHVADQHRVEMHLVSDCEQQVSIDGREFSFTAAETIHTENSHKYPTEVFAEIVSDAGYTIEQTWSDERRWFNLHSVKIAE